MASRPSALAATFGVALSLLTGAALAAPATGRVKVDAGVVEGELRENLSIFRGIPFAAPPTHELRWRAPAPVRPWQGIRAAKSFGPACPQPKITIAGGSDEPQSEDCLYLNIWTPVSSPSPMPVMVWLHGGALLVGSGSMPLYDGARLAARGVIVVTFNYRLGRFGYFAHPALTAEDPGGPLGNYGLMDQLAALRWVQRNIAAFGGDPKNVTVFGESAGAGSIQILMSMPEAAGLFSKAISESGGGNAIYPAIRGDATSAEARGERWAEQAGLVNPTAPQLRSVPSSKLVSEVGLTGFMIDGQLIKEPPGQSFSERRQRPMPLLIGSTSYEASLPILTDERTRKALGAANYAELFKAYRAKAPDEETARSKMRTDLFVAGPARFLARQQASLGAAAYVFSFDYLPEVARKTLPGVPHMGEIPFVLGNFGTLEMLGEGEADRHVADLLADYWTSFARTGRPTSPNGAPWAPVDAGRARTMHFTVEGTEMREADELDARVEYLAMHSPRATDPDLPANPPSN